MTQPDKRPWLVRVREARKKYQEHRASCDTCGLIHPADGRPILCSIGVDLYHAWMTVDK